MEAVTYSLGKNEEEISEYYKNIEVLSKRIINDVKVRGKIFIKDFQDFTRKNHMEILRSEDEYAIEVLLNGVVIEEYMKYALRYKKLEGCYLNILNELRSITKFKDAIDKLKGKTISNICLLYTSVIERTRKYIKTKDYNYELIADSKLPKQNEENEEHQVQYYYKQGDRVTLLDYNKPGIVYKEVDELNNIIVLYNNNFIEVNYKRLKLENTAEELYPEGYDMNQLFVSYKDRKLDHDIERGSKKALKKIQKEMKARKSDMH